MFIFSVYIVPIFVPFTSFLFLFRLHRSYFCSVYIVPIFFRLHRSYFFPFTSFHLKQLENSLWK